MPLIPIELPSETLTDLVRRRAPFPIAREPEPLANRPTAAGMPLAEVLAGRRSVRAFAPAGPSATVLADTLALAELSQRQQWAGHGPTGLRVLVSAARVDGLAPGLYGRDGTGDLWHQFGDPAWRAELPDRYAPAPVLVLVGGSISRTGAAAYGGLLVRAGALGHAIWLAARTYGMEGSVYGRPSTEPARVALSPEEGWRHLFTVALGYSAGGSDDVG